MIIKKITLQDFRNIKNAEFEPCDGINVIYGQNAQGKTNLLEAIWCFTGAKSFRGSKDHELVNLSAEMAKIGLEFFDEQREQECVIDIDKRRKATLNGVEYRSAAEIAGKINAVVFSPLDINIVKDGPQHRRKFLDLSIGQLYPKYIELLRRYNRALDQRNRILKDIKYNPMLEDFLLDFENELCELGFEIVGYRKRHIEALKRYIPTIFDGISDGKEEISIEYDTTVGETKQEMSENLKIARSNDMYSLSTSVGPHRDDLKIEINGLSARTFGSQGQKRSAAISLKLAESAVMREITGKSPIALLDDVMSELDLSRQNYILNHIKDWQVFITCCDPNNIKGLKNGKVFLVENGTVKPQE
ncbi:MAG: DNA replication/repair protein RecF [Ruminococcaceae bacterium]|nr:DNA replication/repair protein RecF [Oscillospiraceae bacterium]